MTTVSIHEAKTHFSSIIGSVERRGEPVIISRHGRPVAEIIPIPIGSRTKISNELNQIQIFEDMTLSTEKEWDDV